MSALARWTRRFTDRHRENGLGNLTAWLARRLHFQNEDLLMASFRAHEFAIAAEVQSAPVRNIFNLLFLCAITVAILLNVPHNSPKGVSLYNHMASTLEQTVENAPELVKAAMPKPVSEFATEAAMSPAQLMNRWEPLITEASKQFGIPATWIRAVMHRESGGRMLLGEGRPITSRAGAMGLMQLMPGTYKEMRVQYRLGANPYDAHDNVIAGAAYLRWLHRRYGFPAMFAAYNDGPGHYEDHVQGGRALPAETKAYIEGITASIDRHGSGTATLTRPDGREITINKAAVRSIRKALPGEYAASVRSVISIGRKRQGVREDVATASAIIGVAHTNT
jgi:soluble lytic murein transglycosylase-like protein